MVMGNVIISVRVAGRIGRILVNRRVWVRVRLMRRIHMRVRIADKVS